MISKAKAKYIRIATRKVRKVMDLVRGKPALQAQALLDNLNRRPCLYIKRVLKSAIDSADKRFHIPASGLYISLIKADQGPTIQRYRAASMGRASDFKHRTTHIIIELDKMKGYEKPEKAKKIKALETGHKTKGVKLGTKSSSV